MSEADRLDIGPATAAEAELFVDWAAAEGWNPGLGDASVFHATDPGGFLLGRLGGEPIAMVSIVQYGPSYGFLGFYIVRPERRRRGFGHRIWGAAIDRAGDRAIGLDAVPTQQASYATWGFELARRNVRYQGEAGGDAPAASDGIVPLAAIPFAQVAAYDAAVYPVPRPGFLASWLAMPGASSFGAVVDGRLAGFGVVRPCRSGSKVGPLFADDPGVAEGLFAALRAAAGPGPLFVDVPDPNVAGVSLVTSHGFAPMFETGRMYRGEVPSEPVERIFGVTTFELG